MLPIHLFVQGIENQLDVIDTPLQRGRPASGRRLHDIHIRLQRERTLGARRLRGSHAGTA